MSFQSHPAGSCGRRAPSVDERVKAMPWHQITLMNKHLHQRTGCLVSRSRGEVRSSATSPVLKTANISCTIARLRPTSARPPLQLKTLSAHRSRQGLRTCGSSSAYAAPMKPRIQLRGVGLGLVLRRSRKLTAITPGAKSHGLAAMCYCDGV